MKTPVYQFTIKEERGWLGSEFIITRTNQSGVEEFLSSHHTYEQALEEVYLATPMLSVISK